MRGKFTQTGVDEKSPRITPACAGKVGLPRFPAAPAQDHPRVCGESLPALHRQLYLLGSPPRVRGKSKKFKHWVTSEGITPACAGKVPVPPFATGIICGSPPRVRGKYQFHNSKTPLLRITPACAGKVGRRNTSGRPARDHPRVCGESDLKAVDTRIREGSPPRVRGKCLSCCCSPARSRITPACAGKVICSSNNQSSDQDHPRVCGESKIPATGLTLPEGSPPRVRGK